MSIFYHKITLFPRQNKILTYKRASDQPTSPFGKKLYNNIISFSDLLIVFALLNKGNFYKLH